MAVYILEYCSYDYYGGSEYTIIGVYTDVNKLEQDYLEYFKALKNTGEPHYDINDWIDQGFNGGIEQGYVPHPMRVSKYLLNNDKAVLYEKDSEIYNACQAKIETLSKNSTF